MTKDKALKMAIEALEFAYDKEDDGYNALMYMKMLDAINACKEALEQPAMPKNCIPLEEVIAEYEKDPEIKAELDKARVRLREWLEQLAQEPLTQEKYEQLKNQSTQWTSSLPMFVHLINKHFGVDDGLDWGQR